MVLTAIMSNSSLFSSLNHVVLLLVIVKVVENVMCEKREEMSAMQADFGVDGWVSCY